MCVELARPRACKGVVDKERPFDENVRVVMILRRIFYNYQHH